MRVFAVPFLQSRGSKGVLAQLNEVPTIFGEKMNVVNYWSVMPSHMLKSRRHPVYGGYPNNRYMLVLVGAPRTWGLLSFPPLNDELIQMATLLRGYSLISTVLLILTGRSRKPKHQYTL